MSLTTIRVGVLGAVALCLLRMGIGWHFFKEGAKKFHGDGFTAEHFLEQATGPWGESFKSWVPDRMGVERLNRERTEQRWQAFHDRVVGQLQLDPKRATQALNEAKTQLEWFHAVHGSEIEEYLLELERYQRALKGDLKEIRFQKEWLATKATELKGKVRPWLGQLKLLDERLESQLYGLAGKTPTRRDSAAIPSSLPLLNTMVKYTVISVGVLLLLGLFTRLACLAGAGFLLSVMITQPPWVEGAQLMQFYYQLVEVLALGVVATCGAGYIGGLDYILRGLWKPTRDVSSKEI